MATMIGLFSSIGEHVPIFKRAKQLEPCAEGTINRLHYRGTCFLILVMCLMVTCPEWISGTGSIIECMHGGSIPDTVINSYCYIQGTFSVPRHYKDFNTQVGNDVSQTGVGPYNPYKDYIQVKAYYQWVPFMLFLQGLMFYIPHIIYKAAEKGKVKNLLGSLRLFQLNKDTRKDDENALAKYFVETMSLHDGWSARMLCAHALYLVNVVGQIFFTDCFLGYEFSTYGVSAASFLEQEAHERTDPMARVFPRVTKCTFHKYGPSGSIQRHDAQCVLPINILNEKIYVFLWFWFAILTSLTILDLIHHLGLISLRSVRKMILQRKLKTAPKFKVDNLKINLNLISSSLSYGDWMLCYHLMQNMDALTYAEWLHELSEQLRDLEEKKLPPSESVPLMTSMVAMIS